jgi:peroxiredoxin
LVAIGAGTLALLEAPLLLHLLRQNRRLKRAAPNVAETAPAVGLPVGSPAPEFELEGTDGERHSLTSLTRGGPEPLLLVFVDARCAPCDLLMPALAESQQRLPIAFVASGDAERIRAKAAEHGLARVLLQRGREVAEAYRAHGTPMAVLIADDQVVSPTAAGAKAVAQLAQQAGAAAPPAVGEPAPDLVLADLDGRATALAELYRERIFVIFWSPGCEYSQRLLPGLHALEREPLPGAPRLIVISDQPAHDVGATVLVDPERRTMRAFGARGTPSAVLVDDGRIASPVVAGPAPVFDLLGEAAALAAS